MLALLNHFDEFFSDTTLRSAPPTRSRLFIPKVDIEESKASYELRADLPGLTQEDVEISVEQGVLTFTGERLRTEPKEAHTMRRSERNLGRFRRTFTLPKDTPAEHITATMQNGQLFISIPKPAPRAATKVPIQGPQD